MGLGHIYRSLTIADLYPLLKEQIKFCCREEDYGYCEKIIGDSYQIDTYKKKIYVYGIALTLEEKDLVISEAKEILDVEDVIASIILVEDLRIQRD